MKVKQMFQFYPNWLFSSRFLINLTGLLVQLCSQLIFFTTPSARTKHPKYKEKE